MSDLLPSLTMTIVCFIAGVGCAYLFYSGIHKAGLRYWMLLPLSFVLFTIAGADSGLGDYADQLVALFIVFLFIGLASTPLDD